MNFYNHISKNTKKLIDKTYDKIKDNYIYGQTIFLEDLWVKKYNALKGPLWPICNGYNDFEELPNHIKKECITTHNFSPLIWKNDIILEADYKFNFAKKDILSLPTMYIDLLSSHKDLFYGKKIIDFACHFGKWSFYFSKQNCASILASDIRTDSIDIAKSIQTDLNIPEEILEFSVADIHDYELLSKLSYDRNTIFLMGIMYHVHDHFNILHSVLQKNVNYIVVEMAESDEIMDSREPLIWWKNEETSDLLAGYFLDKKTISIGYPNLAWYKLILDQAGFKHVGQTKRMSYTHFSKKDEFKETRSLNIFQRK